MKNPYQSILYAGAAIGVLTLVIGSPPHSANAHSGATGIVKERMDGMKMIGRATKTLSKQVRGKEPYNASEVENLAKEIAGHSGQAMTSLFPEDSLGDPTEALPAIWQDWKAFQDLAGILQTSAQALQRSAKNPAQPIEGDLRQQLLQGSVAPEALANLPPEAAFIQIVQTCSACHDRFRKD